MSKYTTTTDAEDSMFYWIERELVTDDWYLICNTGCLEIATNYNWW